MASRFSTEGLASSSARNPWRVVSIWLLILIAASVLSATSLGDALTPDISIDTDAESVEGLDRLESSGLSDAAPIMETVVISSTDGTTIDDPAFQQRVARVTGEIRRLQEEWTAVNGVTYPEVANVYELTQLGRPEADLVVSGTRTSTLIPIGFPVDEPAPTQVDELIDALASFSDGAFAVGTIGTLSINSEFTYTAEEDLVRGESIGIPVALLILIAVFGALLAPIIPILLAIFSIAIALGIVAIIGQFGDVQLFVQNMITMLGLAVGIDYALFSVERYREERRAGLDRQAAIERAGATSSKAVVFSGPTVILSLAGVMLIPALLSLLGDRINWPRKTVVGESHSAGTDIYSGFWGRITKIVMTRPLVSALLAGGLLVAAAIPALDLHTGFSNADALPPSPSRSAYETLSTDFSSGLLAPIEIVIGGDRAAAEPVVDRLVEGLAATDTFAPVGAEPTWSDDAQTGVLATTLLVSADSAEGQAAIEALRESVVPAALADSTGVEIWVGGTPAINVDLLDIVNQWSPWVFVFVLSLSFVLLALAFRSIVVPTKAILLNLLSVGATWGLMVLVFQRGWGNDLLGFQQTPIIEFWIPILLFSILFGLSMDYHVFLLSRIREHYDVTARNRESVAVGLRSTARIITGAALIMVVVFGGFAAGSLVAFQQVGFGLGVAVLIDATIIRSILVPATMALLGNANWYLPHWLHWLPDLRVEGTPPTPAPPAPSGASAD